MTGRAAVISSFSGIVRCSRAGDIFGTPCDPMHPKTASPTKFLDRFLIMMSTDKGAKLPAILLAGLIFEAEYANHYCFGAE